MREIKSLQDYRSQLVSELARVDELIQGLQRLGGVMAPKLSPGDRTPARRAPEGRSARSSGPRQKSRELVLVDILKQRQGQIPVKEVIQAMREAGYQFTSQNPKLNWIYMAPAKKHFKVEKAVVKLKEPQ